MTNVPPEMVFDAEFDQEYDESPRPRREKRPESAWEKQAANWRAPEFRATCCGTSYGAMTPGDLGLMLQAHQERNPAAEHTRRAPIALGQNV